MPLRAVRPFLLAMLVLTLTASQPAAGQIPDFKTGGSVPTLAPLVRQVTPAVVNISVHGRVREDNPLYRDPVFREFFDVPRQIEKEVSATGSGVIVDAQRGYVLTNNHVVEGTSAVQVTTKDGRQFSAKVIGRDPPTDIAVLQLQSPVGLKALAFGDRRLGNSRLGGWLRFLPHCANNRLNIFALNGAEQGDQQQIDQHGNRQDIQQRKGFH